MIPNKTQRKQDENNAGTLKYQQCERDYRD